MHVEHVGPISLADHDTLYAHLEEAVEHHGVRYYLLDLTHAGPPAPAARRKLSTYEATLDVWVVAFGASPVMRLITGMLQRAMALLGRPSQRFCMLATEAEAQTWIATHRARTTHPAELSLPEK